MKYTKLLILTLLTAMTFSACGTDDSLQFRFPDQENKDDNTGGGTGESTDKTNSNKNVATANMPAVVKNAINGLEFPKLKNNGSSYAIVHMDNTTGMVNFSTEWDDDMKSQRWSCYTFHTGNTASNVDRWKQLRASASIHGIPTCRSSGTLPISPKTLPQPSRDSTTVISVLLPTAS